MKRGREIQKGNKLIASTGFPALTVPTWTSEILHRLLHKIFNDQANNKTVHANNVQWFLFSFRSERHQPKPLTNEVGGGWMASGNVKC